MTPVLSTPVVVPVQGSLVLGRNFTEICKFAVAANQPNAGKCSVARSTYQGEICIGEFPIPAAHLEGFATWDDTGETPAQVLYTDGAGVADTDFILYVTAATTTRCQNDHSVLAYASYCQLDQNSRPTAGYTNFCPVQLQGPSFDRDKFVMTAVHELLHALGFSKQLFDKFKDCSSSADPTSCPDRRDVVETVRGLSRLTTPAVLNRTRHHFSCTWTDFGGPLEDRPAGVSSHWEARLMQGSIMTAKLGQPHLTTIDAVTLAMFEDSGWYQVDYSTAGSLVWGQDQGCTFGTEATCVTSNDWFCLGSSVGCHYLHLDKGRCESDSYLGVCRVYKPQPGDECWKGSSAPSTLQLELHGESYQEASRCFISNLTKTGLGGTSSPAGRCYEHRCNSTGVLEVRVQGSPWVRCPFGFSIAVPGYSGALACPPPGVLCRDVFPPPHTTTAATTQADSCPTGNAHTPPSPPHTTPPSPHHSTPLPTPPLRQQLRLRAAPQVILTHHYPLPTTPPSPHQPPSPQHPLPTTHPPPHTTTAATTQADSCPTGNAHTPLSPPHNTPPPSPHQPPSPQHPLPTTHPPPHTPLPTHTLPTPPLQQQLRLTAAPQVMLTLHYPLPTTPPSPHQPPSPQHPLPTTPPPPHTTTAATTQADSCPTGNTHTPLSPPLPTPLHPPPHTTPPPPHTTTAATTQADSCPTGNAHTPLSPPHNTPPPSPHHTTPPPPHTTTAATTQADSCPTGAPDDRNEEVHLELTFPAEVARLTQADLSAFRDLVAMEMAVLACISRNRVAVRPEDQLKAHLVIVRLYPSHNSTEGPGCAGVFAHLEASVRAGRFIVTFRGTPYRAAGIRLVDGKPVRRPPATVAMAMGVVGGLLLLVVVVVLIFFYKAKTPRTVAPATPSRASSITLQRF
ncbi:RP11-244E17.1 [Branchiostoma lanceolatum]|uniref:RP11-244E17.1 protein n=1 Tax=Branchiostoma lanceolatum TaxID=7740 RepID=A0A8J9ZPT0_BRALA|nr:RP11-244E17.1 [Branchiostoma lanceolatum]